MNIATLKLLLDASSRNLLLDIILDELEEVKKMKYIDYQTFEISEGIIPLIKISNSSKPDEIQHVKVFIGAQHNEYNGLFGVLEFFKLIREGEIEINEIIRKDQILYFLPLMNPYGFLNPNRDNKSGYYLENGTNLNRFWRRAFAPNYKDGKKDLDELPIPEQVHLIKNLFQKYWDDDKIALYILDFHETSLLERYPIELAKNLHLFYKFDHWLKEEIVLNIIKLYSIPFYRKPLFYKCNPSSDHNHLNLTHSQFETVFHNLHEYLSRNQGKGKLPFYFCYSNKSRDYCMKLATIVYKKLKVKLWETYYPAFNHHFINHGCFVRMSDATPRPRVYSMELESQKHFFNLFEEVKKSKSKPNYFEKKLDLINVSIELALESIKEMITLY